MSPITRSSKTRTSSTYTWEPKKISRIARDVKESKRTSLSSFLLALLARLSLHAGGRCCSSAKLYKKDDEVDQARTILNDMLRDATTFCNDKRRSKKFRTHLCDYQKREKKRSNPLCSALNTILATFRDKEYGHLAAPSNCEDGEELIFMSNEHTFIESDHIARHASASKRKPDIVATSISTLKKNYTGKPKVKFGDWVQLVSSGRFSELVSRKGQWLDIRMAWDLDVIDKELKLNDASKSEDATRPLSCNRKRRSDDTLSGDKKRARVSDPCSTPNSFRALDKQHNLVPDLRCAYYALERLRTACHVTHSMGVLLEDSLLSLRWYDAQGCIQSEAVDIMEELPTFVVLIVIFQRLDSRMWGLGGADSVVQRIFGRSAELTTECRGRFELVGRQTYCASVSSPEVSELGEGAADSLFLKSSWSEERQEVKEPGIIKIAHDRASKLLPERYRDMVTNHIPTVVTSYEGSAESTSAIRLMMKKSNGLEEMSINDICDHARVQVVMVTQRLHPVRNLSPADFWQAFWDIIRCHFLLWRIGIAHRDISLENIMFIEREGRLRGVLNDYDMAAVMSPGVRYPGSDNNTFAGTRPFMALDLLDYPIEGLKRWYRYDLESFTWCLMWMMIESPPTWWLEGDIEVLSMNKGAFMSRIDFQPLSIRREWVPFGLLLIDWFSNWNAHYDRLSHAAPESVKSGLKTREEKIVIRNVEDEGVMDLDHVRFVLKRAAELKLDSKAEALQDISWASVELFTN